MRKLSIGATALGFAAVAFGSLDAGLCQQNINILKRDNPKLVSYEEFGRELHAPVDLQQIANLESLRGHANYVQERYLELSSGLRYEERKAFDDNKFEAQIAKTVAMYSSIPAMIGMIGIALTRPQRE